MKILTVNNTADIYGASRCMERVFSRFVEEGHEVHAVLPEMGPLVDLLQSRGIRVHLHPGLCVVDRAQVRNVKGCLRLAVSFPLSVLWLAFLLLRLRIELVHTNSVVIVSPAVAAKLTGRRHVWHVRELLGEFGRLWRPFQRAVYAFSDAIVAISECVRDQFAPALRDKISVIYDGLDEGAGVVSDQVRADLRSRFPAEATLIGVVGRIKFHRKGQEILVKAASLLRSKFPGAYYVVVGSASPGNEAQVVQLRELIAELHVADRVALVGEFADPASVFAALDIAVVPSVQAEPFGCVVMEAMAVGTPVVGSDCGGIPEQIVDGHSGLLFPPGDAAALAGSLERLLNDRSLRCELAQNALGRVQSVFSLDGTYRAMARLFGNLDGPRMDVAVGSMSE